MKEIGLASMLLALFIISAYSTDASRHIAFFCFGFGIATYVLNGINEHHS